MRKHACIVNMVAIIVGFLGGSVLKVDLSGMVNKKGVFGFCIEIDICRISLYFSSL